MLLGPLFLPPKPATAEKTRDIREHKAAEYPAHEESVRGLRTAGALLHAALRWPRAPVGAHC